MHLSLDHAGHHDCGHHHATPALNRAFAIAVLLNVLLVVGEAIAGWMSGSIALLADAGHNLGDVAGLILAWWAHWLRGKGRSGRWTYGWRAFTILAANINGLLLIVTVAGVSIESVRRLIAPTEISEWPVLTVALIAAMLNFATARLLAGRGDDLNVRGAYLHMMADAAVSLAVVVGAVLIMLSGQYWIDPAVSIGICVILLVGTLKLLRDATSMMMHAAPRQLEVTEVREFLASTPAVENVLDLHVWSVSTSDVLLTTRLSCPGTSAEEQDGLLSELHAGLHEQFGIDHATIEIVVGKVPNASCALD